jgi:AcrR family transcriptional regulator
MTTPSSLHAPSDTPTTADGIVRAAGQILEREGLDALSTRTIASAAGVPAPTIFRLFGDKQGLLEAVAWLGFRTYLQQKVELLAIDDPVEVLRRAWDLHVDFGLAHPAYYRLVFDQARPDGPTQAGTAALAGLQAMVASVARAGRLRMSVERATLYMHANGVGTVFTLLSLAQAGRDTQLATVTRDAVLETITTDAPRKEAKKIASIRNHAGALREILQREAPESLTNGERALLDEWLKRLSDAP